jgi:hypothetical protein
MKILPGQIVYKLVNRSEWMIGRNKARFLITIS